jgi:hypothetical protein
MSKKKASRQDGNAEFRRPEIIDLPDLKDVRIRHIPAYRRDYKRTIERFFRNQSFPERAAKKRPRNEKTHMSRACKFSALVEAMERRVEDQQQEHKSTLRKAGSSK